MEAGEQLLDNQLRSARSALNAARRAYLTHGEAVQEALDQDAEYYLDTVSEIHQLIETPEDKSPLATVSPAQSTFLTDEYTRRLRGLDAMLPIDSKVRTIGHATGAIMLAGAFRLTGDITNLHVLGTVGSEACGAFGFGNMIYDRDIKSLVKTKARTIGTIQDFNDTFTKEQALLPEYRKMRQKHQRRVRRVSMGIFSIGMAANLIF